MDLKQMQYFLAVAEQSSFSRAAEILYVTQPLLSQKVAELEQELGVTLLNRTRRSVQLTPAGMVFADKVRSILAEVNSLGPLVQRAQSGTGQEYALRIGYEEVFERTQITQAVFRTHAEHPNCYCQIKQYNLGQIMSAIQEREIDLAFTLLPNPRFNPDLVIQQVGDDQLSLGVASSLLKACNASSLESFLSLYNNYPLLLMDNDRRGMASILELCLELGITPSMEFHQEVRTILLNVEAGRGVTILPSGVLQNYASPYISTYRLEASPIAKLERIGCWLKDNPNPAIPLFLRHIEQ